MAYLTEAKLKARVGGETNWLALTDDNADGTPDADVTAALLASVDEEANAYFRAGGYTTPLNETQLAPVYNALLDLANYRAYTRSGRQASPGDRQLYEDARALLEAISKRTVLLVAASSIPLVGEYVVDSEPEMFSRTKLRNY